MNVATTKKQNLKSTIKICHPKAFQRVKAGQELMLDVETKAQQKLPRIWTVPCK